MAVFFPYGLAGKESACNAGDMGSIAWIEKIPWRGERLPTPVFRPGEFHGLYSPWGGKESDTTQHSLTHFLSKGWVAPSGALSYTVKSHLSSLQDECVCV